MSATVRDNPAENRYEVTVDGELAGFSTYHLSGPRITLIHTEVDDAFERQGIGKLLAEYVLDAARDAGLAVIPKCPFMAAYIKATREYVDLVPEDRRAEFGLDDAEPDTESDDTESDDTESDDTESDKGSGGS